MWGPRSPNLWRTELMLQILHPFRSQLPRIPRLMILGSESLVIKAFLPWGAFCEYNPHLHRAYNRDFRHYNSHTDNDDSSDEYLANNEHFLFAPENYERIDFSPDFSIVGQSKKALNYLPAASIVRHIIIVYISYFYYDSHVRLRLNLFFYCCIFFSLNWRFWFLFHFLYLSLSVLNDR